MKIDDKKLFDYSYTIGELDRFKKVSDALEILKNHGYLGKELLKTLEEKVKETFGDSFISDKFRRDDQEFFFKYFHNRKTP
jgi:hypothetical protein